MLVARCILAGLLLAQGLARADDMVDPWRFCGPGPELQPLPGNQLDDGLLHFSADHAQLISKRFLLEGNVSGVHGEDLITADRLIYDTEQGTARVEGSVRYQRGSSLLLGDKADMTLAADAGHIEGARFWLLGKHLRGHADSLLLESNDRMRLSNALITTCDEGHEFWRLVTSDLHLIAARNEGIARHMRLEVMHVPIFYSPYLSFPLQGRKTGLLVPTLGESSESGTEISQPFYWNIAPDQDATFTPRYMSRRGVLWDTEYRYLNRRSQGEINVAYLGDDKVYGAERSAVFFRHEAGPAPGWRGSIDYREVSDADYLNDFGGQLSTSSVTHLERRAELSYRSDSWQAGLLAQDFQTVDQTLAPVERPYARLPQLRWRWFGVSGPAGLSLSANAEWVRFQHEVGVQGERLDIQPTISWPLEGDAGYLLPRLSLRHTRYRLQEQDPASDANPQRSLPIFSLDSGLFFERPISGLGSARLQTLEPRLFYLYVPYRQQADLIVDAAGNPQVFDSSRPLFSIDQLLRENRFSGADRVGDANQLSALLSSRLLSSEGRELARASVGRIIYFTDRRVTLPGEAVETGQVSNWLGELSSQWTERFSSRLSVEWNPNAANVERSALSLRFHPGRREALNLAYFSERDQLEQADASFVWPVNERLSLLGRWRYSLLDKENLENMAGFEYESCCWALRLVQRRYRVATGNHDLNASIWLQLELKGLTNVGRNVETLLERDILAP